MSPLTSFIIVADKVKFRVLQEGAFTSSTVDYKTRILYFPQIFFSLIGLAVPQQRQRKNLFRHRVSDTENTNLMK